MFPITFRNAERKDCGKILEFIKKLAEYVTCHCNKGAVADFINYLENKYIKTDK